MDEKITEQKPKMLFMKHDANISDRDKEILKEAGYEVIQVTNPAEVVEGIAVPVTPLVMPGDKVTRLMLRALQKYKPARDEFSVMLINEMLK